MAVAAPPPLELLALPEKEPATPSENGIEPFLSAPPTGVEVELRCVLASGHRDPRFSIIIHLADGTSDTKDLTLNDPLHGDWTVSEFNPLRQTVTIANGGTFRILNRGERVSLD